MGNIPGSELEATLLALPLVETCAVLERRGSQGLETVAYVVGRGPLSAATVRAHVRDTAPSAPLPDRFAIVTRLPFTPAGELDEAALEAIPVVDLALAHDVEARLSGVSGVAHAAVFVDEQPGAPELLHETQLLAEPLGKGTNAAPPSARRAARETLPAGTPAEVEGAPLSIRPDVPRTLPDALRGAAARVTDPRITYLGHGQSVRRETFAALLSEARRIHGGLSEAGVERGQIVLFQLERPEDILPMFWGCLLGGFVPVITAVPASYAEETNELLRLCQVVRLLERPFIVAPGAVDAAPLLARTELGADRLLALSVLRRAKAVPDVTDVDPSSAAFLTLTSGSTGTPKAIMLSHVNILTRARGTNRLCSHSEEDRILNWLPFDHIGSISDWHLRCVILGCHMVYCTKEYVLGDPLNWLRLIDRFRITHSWAPNFAYALVVEAVKKSGGHWDLSCLRSLLTAGESVSSKTVRQFLELLAGHGLSSTAIRPAFGMAELGSGVTYYLPTSENPVRVRHVDRAHLDGALRLVEPSDPRAASFTSLGPVIPSARMRVVDEYDRVQPENTVGRLQIGGGPVCLGYYKNPEANREVFAGEGWFNTGDRGFLSGGELYLTGRDKETLVINGANYHNSEIEAAVEVVPGVRVSFTAACAVRDAAHGERLAIFFCAEAVDDAALRATFAEVQNGISRKTGVKVDYLLPVSPRDIPKTAIGKIQRKELVKRFERGDFGALVRRVDVLLQNERTLPDWFLRPSFGAKALPSQIELGERRRVLLLEDEYGLAAYVRAFLGDLGLAVTSVPAGAEVPVMPPAVTDVVDLSDYGPLGAVNDAGGRDTGGRAQGRIVELAHHVSSRSAAAADSRKLRYCVVASHSQAAVPEDSVDPARAMVPAVLAALSQEHAVAGAHVDAPFVRGAYALAEVARFVVAECLARSRDEEVVYRSTQRFVRAFERVKWPESAPAEATLERGALYLITGGLGGVGAELSRFLLSRFGVELVVVGRAPVQGAGADPARRAVLADLERRGVVVYEAADVTDAASLKDALARAEARAGKRVSGAFHLASAYHEQPLARETATSLDTLIAPKLHGAEAVHAALADRDAFVVCFTSLAGVSSGAGIGAYAAANRLVDAFCHEQRRRGRASYSLSWSVWKGLGIGADAPVQALRAKGYQPISPAKGFVSLLAVLGQGPSHFLVGVDPAHPALACRVEAPARAAHTLLAAVVPREGATPELPAAFDDCGHPVPLELRVLARGPLTAEGTLDRDAALAVLRGRANGVARSPSTPLQKQLAAIWSDLLGVDSVSIDDSFFDLGGTSLLSVRLFAEIERLFGVGLPLATLFRAPTIEALCALLEAEHSVEEARSLRLLSPREASVALHLIHDVDGATDPFQPLADALDGSVRVYAIGPHAEGSFPVLHTRVEEMAEYYVGKIRRAQPEGPYHVGGLGIGGVLAHAVACRLQAGGERVGLVALLDSMDSAWRPGSSTGRSGIFRKIDVGFAQYLKTGTARISNALTRTGMEYARVKLLRHYVDRGERPPWFLEHIPLETVYRFAVSEYVAERFEGRVTLLRATAGTPADATDIPAREQCPDPYFGWTFRATSGVAVHDVAGGHRTLLDAAHVAATARALKRALGLECHDVAAAS